VTDRPAAINYLVGAPARASMNAPAPPCPRKDAMRPAALACLFVIACVDRPLTELDPIPESVEAEELPANLNRAVDLLFVIDNSGSMSQEHASLTNRFPELIASLTALGDDLPDLHIGVVTSDLGTGSISLPGGRCDATGGDGGRMTGGRCAALGGATFITDDLGPSGERVRNYSGALTDAFACLADVGDEGCGFEQHLEAMRRALDPATNPGFLRRGAELAVIIVADEDDCSTADDRLFGSTDPALGPLSDFRCFAQGVVCDPVPDPRSPGLRTNCRPNPAPGYLHTIEAYVTFLRDLKPDPTMISVGVIVGDPDPVEVVTSGTTSTLAPSCTGGLGEAAPAIRIAGLVDAIAELNERGRRETICTGDLGAALGDLGANLGGSGACFESPLVDRDPIATGLQPECAIIEHRADGTALPLPACLSGGARPCWRITSDPRCRQTPRGDRLAIERDGPAPADATIELQCVVSGATP
jgi:hypothetical protein